ncbi:MAG: hypothetical protein R3200_07760 [Xanthomonadales bacterium]|nr:hypothetical protein [Xanthomonadales bacterium]
MTHMLIRHRVGDFDRWRQLFEEHRSAREAAGITDLNLWRDVENPNDVVLIFSVSDLDRARAFAASEDLRNKMRAAGVVDEPEIAFLTP